MLTVGGKRYEYQFVLDKEGKRIELCLLKELSNSSDKDSCDFTYMTVERDEPEH